MCVRLLYNQTTAFAGVMELVDVLDSKSSAARRAGSSPATGTITTEASAVLFSPQGETERWWLLFLMQISYMTLRFRKIRLKAPAPIFKRLTPVFLEFLRFILLQNNWICLELMTAHGIIKWRIALHYE